MGAELDAALCRCGEERAEHKRGTGGCKDPDCGCAKFEPTDRSAPQLTGPVLDVGVLLGEVQADADREAELTATVDRLTAELGRAMGSLRATERELATLASERDEARRQRDAWMQTQTESAQKLTAERDGAAEQWAKARERLEALRGDLAAVKRQLTREQAETAKLRAQLDRGDLGQRLYTAYDVWLCTVCGGRYRHHHNHPCAPLTERLHVVITYIEGAPTA